MGCGGGGLDPTMGRLYSSQARVITVKLASQKSGGKLCKNFQILIGLGRFLDSANFYCLWKTPKPVKVVSSKTKV